MDESVKNRLPLAVVPGNLQNFPHGIQDKGNCKDQSASGQPVICHVGHTYRWLGTIGNRHSRRICELSSTPWLPLSTEISVACFLLSGSILNGSEATSLSLSSDQLRRGSECCLGTEQRDSSESAQHVHCMKIANALPNPSRRASPRDNFQFP